VQIERGPGKRYDSEVVEIRGYYPENDRYDLQTDFLTLRPAAGPLMQVYIPASIGHQRSQMDVRLLIKSDFFDKLPDLMQIELGIYTQLYRACFRMDPHRATKSITTRQAYNHQFL
jgi:hypothetical protein